MIEVLQEEVVAKTIRHQAASPICTTLMTESSGQNKEASKRKTRMITAPINVSGHAEEAPRPR